MTLFWRLKETNLDGKDFYIAIHSFYLSEPIILIDVSLYYLFLVSKY